MAGRRRTSWSLHDPAEGPSSGTRWVKVSFMLPSEEGRGVQRGKVKGCGSFEARFLGSLVFFHERIREPSGIMLLIFVVPPDIDPNVPETPNPKMLESGKA